MRTPNAPVEALRSLAAEAPLLIRVKGDCMAPELPDGATVAIAPVARYWPGDVVAFGAGLERLTLHRVIGYRRLGGRFAVLTQADSGAEADAPITPTTIVGRVVGVIDRGGGDGRDGALSPVAPRRALALRRWVAYLASAVARRLRRRAAPTG